MRLTVHAEIVAGRDTVVFIAAGDDLCGRLGRVLSRLTPHVTPTTPRGGLQAPLSWPLVVQVVAQLRDTCGTWHPGPHLSAWIAEQVLHRTSPRPLEYQVPEGLEPYPWQAEGAAMLAAAGGGLLFDEPGCGKTVTAVLAVAELRHRAGSADHPVVVVCPASVVDPWVDALEAWGRLRAVAWRGTPARRRSLAGTADAYVTTYETARVDTGTVTNPGPLLLLRASQVVVDEHHVMKNPDAKRTKAVRRLAERAAHVVGLSGTPITHHPGDLWPMLAALDPAAYPSRWRWVHRYCDVATTAYDTEITGLNQCREPEFRLCLQGQSRRVAKADALALPPKVYSTRTVELPPPWRKVYDAMEAQMLAELPDGGELSVMSVLAQLTRLSQLASAAADVRTTVDVAADGTEQVSTRVVLRRPSWKVDALLEVLAERPGDPVVVFAPSKQLIRLAGEAAAAAGRRVGYITGDVTGPARTETVAGFQRGDLDLVCATTGAGGVGITLTAARCAVFLQRPWSLVEATQAEDRLHRIGAERHRSIDIVDIVARDTIDARVRRVLRTRAGQLADLVQDPRVVASLLGGRDTNAA